MSTSDCLLPFLPILCFIRKHASLGSQEEGCNLSILYAPFHPEEENVELRLKVQHHTVLGWQLGKGAGVWVAWDDTGKEVLSGREMGAGW